MTRKRWLELAGAAVLAIILGTWAASKNFELVGRSDPKWNAAFGPAPNGFWEWLYTGKLPKVREDSSR